MSRLAAPLALALLLTACGTDASEADEGKASPVGLVVLVLFLIAVVLLVRSMTKHLRRVPESFEDTAPEAPSDEAAAPTEGEQEADAEPQPDAGDLPETGDQRKP